MTAETSSALSQPQVHTAALAQAVGQGASWKPCTEQGPHWFHLPAHLHQGHCIHSRRGSLGLGKALAEGVGDYLTE